MRYVDPDGRETNPLGTAYTVTGKFGSAYSAGRKPDMDRHAGVDEASTTREVIASLAGTVVFAGVHPQGQGVATGCLVLVKNDDGTYELYGHMDPNDLSVKAGDSVAEGQGLGKYFDGKIGSSSGGHLHFEKYQIDNPSSDASELVKSLNGTGYFYDTNEVPDDLKTINSNGTILQVVKPSDSLLCE